MLLTSAIAHLLEAAGAASLALGAMLATRPRPLPPLDAINGGIARMDLADMPELSRFQARDGTWLAYRLYPAPGEAFAILVHGSSGLSDSMNGLAKTFARDGFTAVAIDVRGHGASGSRGDIGYAGQTGHDLEDLVAHLRRTRPAARFTLVGHSSGGGFAARISATPTGRLFDRFVLVAPFLGPSAPSTAPGNRRWASVALPRILALALLRRLGIALGEQLPVIALATDPAGGLHQTPVYSFRLLADYGPDFDWRRTKAAIAASAKKIAVVAAGRDELMDSQAYVRELQPLGVAVTVLPEHGHMSVYYDPAALAAVVAAAKGG